MAGDDKRQKSCPVRTGAFDVRRACAHGSWDGMLGAF